MKINTSLRTLVVAFLGLVTTSCKAGGAASPFTVLAEDSSALRHRFNEDIGKTRVVMLVAPT